MTGACEPRQVREEAAVSKSARVVAASISPLQASPASSARIKGGRTAKDPFLIPYPQHLVPPPLRALAGPEGIVAFQYGALGSEPGLVHAVFSRKGGKSPPPFESLNVSDAVGDDPHRVRGNLMRVQKALGAEALVLARQIHGSGIWHVAGRDAHERPRADGLLTRERGVALMVKAADCQAVILFDPRRRALGLIHCGWRGQVRNILASAVRRMEALWGCRPQELRAAIGPSLGPCCAEFRDAQRLFPAYFHEFRIAEWRYDLWSLSVSQLEACGLKREAIEVAGICTRCRTDLFYSHRGEGKTGRFAVAAMLVG